MAIQDTRTLPAPFIETLGQDLAKQLPALTGQALDTSKFAPSVAPQDALQTQAATMAGTSGQGIGAFSPYLTAAQGYTGPTAYQQFMSPYQQDVIDASLTEFDAQAGRQRQGIRDRAIQAGAFGGGREGAELSQYQAASDRNRAILQSGLLQQGFGQAQQAAAQAFGQQQGLASLVPSLYQQDIATLGSVGATQQAQAQAERDATREQNRMAAFEPYERLGFYQSGVTGLMGGYPGQYQFSAIPNPTPLQTGLGTAATLAGIYGAVRNPSGVQQPFSGLEKFLTQR